MSHFQDAFWVGNGFDELHRYMKQGNELCKDLEIILSERAHLENEYVKGLHKLTKKAKNASRKCIGSLETAWHKLVEGLEAEAEVHKSLALGLNQDCSKILKAFTEQQIRQREPVESAVEKQHKAFLEKYRQQMKCKKSAHKQCRDLESCWDQLEDAKNGRGKVMSEKDIHRLEKNCRKMEEGLIKADREYRDTNLKTEEARLAYESAMYRCCQTVETLELERLQQLQGILNKYCELVITIIRPTEQSCEELVQVSEQISPEEDVEFTCSTIGTGPNQPEQLLIDYYEEDLQNGMNSLRRRGNLEKKIQALEREMDRQQKARQGIESLSKVYQETPDFCDERGADDVTRQLAESDAMLNMLRANHFKLLCAHAEISNAPRPSSHFDEYIHTSKDKQGQTMSILRIPLEQLDSIQPGDYETHHTYALVKKKPANSLPRYKEADWHNGEEEFDDSDEYTDMQDKDRATLEFNEGDGYEYISKCEVQYSYSANQSDELTIEPGDIINVIDKQDADWWQGELNGTVGIFPATYVQEIS